MLSSKVHSIKTHSGVENLSAPLIPTHSIYDDASYELPEERRKAILEFGLPDDGYDYLRHLRTAGPQRAGGLRSLSNVCNLCCMWANAPAL
jgi:hypothetical protein